MAEPQKEISRPPKEIIEALREVGSATASGELAKLGVRSAHILGPVARTPGASIVGPALTLQFMPRREDLHKTGEYQTPSTTRNPGTSSSSMRAAT